MIPISWLFFEAANSFKLIWPRTDSGNTTPLFICRKRHQEVGRWPCHWCPRQPRGYTGSIHVPEEKATEAKQLLSETDNKFIAKHIVYDNLELIPVSAEVWVGPQNFINTLRFFKGKDDKIKRFRLTGHRVVNLLFKKILDFHCH